MVNYKKMLVTAALILAIIVVACLASPSSKGGSSNSATPQNAAGATELSHANEVWSWRGAANGIVVDVEADEGRVYLLVKTDDSRLYLYLINASSGIFINKTLLSSDVNSAAMKLRGEDVVVSIVDNDGRVRIIEYNAATARIMKDDVLGNVDVNVIDVMDVVIGNQSLILVGGAHTQEGLRPIIILVTYAGEQWRKVIEDDSGYFMDAVLASPDNVVCAVTPASVLYCFNSNGTLLFRKSLEAKVTQLLRVDGKLAALGLSDNGSITFLLIEIPSGGLLQAKVIGTGYPLSSQLASGKLVILAENYVEGESRSVVLLFNTSLNDGIVKLGNLKGVLVEKDGEASLFKIACNDESIFLAGRIGVKPFVIAIAYP